LLLIGLLTGKVVIGAESRLKQNYTNEKAHELRSEEDSTTNVKEATRKLIELAANKTKFEGMRCDVENKEVFRTFVNICLIHFCSSINWRYTAYNTVVSDIFTESDEAFCMLLLENNVDDYGLLVNLDRQLTRKEARPKYSTISNESEVSKGWSRKGIKRYNDLVKIVRSGRRTEFSKEMEIDLKLKYAVLCGKSGISNSLGENGDSDDSDDEDLEAYDGFAGELTAINVEHTDAV